MDLGKKMRPTLGEWDGKREGGIERKREREREEEKGRGREREREREREGEREGRKSPPSRRF